MWVQSCGAAEYVSGLPADGGDVTCTACGTCAAGQKQTAACEPGDYSKLGSATACQDYTVCCRARGLCGRGSLLLLRDGTGRGVSPETKLLWRELRGGRGCTACGQCVCVCVLMVVLGWDAGGRVWGRLLKMGCV